MLNYLFSHQIATAFSPGLHLCPSFHNPVSLPATVSSAFSPPAPGRHHTLSLPAGASSARSCPSPLGPPDPPLASMPGASEYGLGIALVSVAAICLSLRTSGRTSERKQGEDDRRDAMTKRPPSPSKKEDPSPLRRKFMGISEDLVVAYSVPLKFDEDDCSVSVPDDDPAVSDSEDDSSAEDGIVIVRGCDDDDAEPLPFAALPQRARADAFDETLQPSCDGSSVSSAVSSVPSAGSPGSRRSSTISFATDVAVALIPKFDEYPLAVRRRIWGTTDEIYENAVRNSFEFAAEGWDWRTVALDETMYECQITGELIHPVHCNAYYQSRSPTAA
eukprot:CAMPEP_0113330558 /NCGR_PEP_ID=MMETSP0010_2-20120614/21719_1 /TAXON_ID=216773 ORGANISM="Corethron hystrix, Strain 308" /NCGR_SAMPLE_ID=MMETSP0010_2 /ASSEMBLY_ACC=CAM_ASM_000155 /LENGTH=331 /DNA_ID=CAMNT_0000193165 /DNA_START=346 /DNA_END=1341 /DNA_ORIENTATION=+ /assembly_acc=CAM_ASM_000155